MSFFKRRGSFAGRDDDSGGNNKRLCPDDINGLGMARTGRDSRSLEHGDLLPDGLLPWSNNMSTEQEAAIEEGNVPQNPLGISNPQFYVGDGEAFATTNISMGMNLPMLDYGSMGDVAPVMNYDAVDLLNDGTQYANYQGNSNNANIMDRTPWAPLEQEMLIMPVDADGATRADIGHPHSILLWNSISLLAPDTHSNANSPMSLGAITSSSAICPQNDSGRAITPACYSPMSEDGLQSSNTKSISEDDEVRGVEFDTCFGEIVTNATSSFKEDEGKKSARVKIEPFGNMLKLTFTESKKYAGIISIPALNAMLEEHTVKVVAMLFAPEITKGKGKKKAEPVVDSTIRMLVYGKLDDKQSVGACLSEGGVFLQHPTMADYDPAIPYLNPHFLVRPGGKMPSPENFAIDDRPEGSNGAVTMSRNEKSKIMRIFDSANRPVAGTFREIKPSPRLATTLKEHQLVALSMMLERESGRLDDLHFPSLWEKVKDGTQEYRNLITGRREVAPAPLNGGVLADEMGLGKTLSVLGLVCAGLDGLDERTLPEVYPRATLVVVPKSSKLGSTCGGAVESGDSLTDEAIPAWEKQIKTHIRPDQLRYIVYHGPKRLNIVQSLHRDYDIVITTYETLQRESAGSGRLHSETWCRVVLDEAHRIRNRSSENFKAATTIKAYFRWCLTGTPIQNSLDDYGALLAFLQVPTLREKRGFEYWITGRVHNNKHLSVHGILQGLIAATCFRRTKAMVKQTVELPAKKEVVQAVQLAGTDREIYEFFKGKASRSATELYETNPMAPDKGDDRRQNTMSLITILRLICNHGEQLLPKPALALWRQQQQEVQQASRASSQARDESAISLHNPSQTILQNPADRDFSPSGFSPPCPSAKVQALLRNLKTEQREFRDTAHGPKKSQWTKMLDLVANALQQNNYRYARIDGQSSLTQRLSEMETFNYNSGCTAMLASIGSAAEGIDLTTACYVHLLEPHWNPMIEAQAVDRVHRIGQLSDVLVTRYLTTNSIEDYVRWIQQDKVQMINASLDATAVTKFELDQQRYERLKLALRGLPI